MRDEATKRERGYVEADTIVRFDGSEKLTGRDWRRRKAELAARSGGICEQKGCKRLAADPHHIIARSKKRDDRLFNLAHLCRLHHLLLDWKTLIWTRNKL